ncbi:MAG: DoxX family protein [Pseudomonadales bacterium]|nr:DoxX family protein [Pseudomonadales bacterium]
MIAKASNLYKRGLAAIRPWDGIAPLLIRLFLATFLIEAGWRKFAHFEGTVGFFDTLGIPLPAMAAALAGLAEFGGGILILVGLATRLAAVPLLFTMLVAGYTAHWDHGWQTVSDASLWTANERVLEADEKKKIIRTMVREHPDSKWLTSTGRVTILNNGIQFAATLFAMLLSLLFTGGGRYTSADYWICRQLKLH